MSVLDNKITVKLLLLSILALEDPKLVSKKLKVLENQLKLNEVEQKIVENIYEGIQVQSTPSQDFITEKFDYYFNDIILDSDLYSVDALDSAIADVRAGQLRRSISKQLIDLGGNIDNMTPRDIRDHVGELYTNALIESKGTTPPNSLQKRKNAYDDYTQHMDGLLLVEDEVEKYAGRAAPGTVVSVLAFTGEYKSTFCMNIAYINAMAGKNILYLMFESTGMKLEQKLVCLHKAKAAKDRTELVKLNWVREKKLTPEQQAHFNMKQNEMVDQLNDHLIVWDTSDIDIDTFIDMADVYRKADKMFTDKTGSGIDGIIIDQVSLLKYTAAGGKNYGYDGAVINAWVNWFREQTLNFLDTGRQIVTFNVSQVRREAFAAASKDKNKGRYDSSCSSDSHEIERTSDTMITLFKDKEMQNNVLINIPKAREGEIPAFPIEVEVHGEYGLFGPIPCDNYGSVITAEDFTKEEVNITDFFPDEE